jgi:hypothetical protein
MENNRYKQIGHMIRWALEIIIIWLFVYVETGGWTAFALTMLTLGVEFDHFNKDDWIAR